MPAPTIIYTHTDEAPALATHTRFFPILQDLRKLLRHRDRNPRHLPRGPHRQPFPRASGSNPNSASTIALAELGCPRHRPPRPTSSSFPTSAPPCPSSKPPSRNSRSRASACPTTPTRLGTDEERDVQARYDSRQRQRRQPRPPRRKLRPPRPPCRQGIRPSQPASHGRLVLRLEDARLHPWATERFLPRQRTIRRPSPRPTRRLRIEHHSKNGEVTVLKDDLALLAGEIIDATCHPQEAAMLSWRSSNAQIARRKRRAASSSRST